MFNTFHLRIGLSKLSTKVGSLQRITSNIDRWSIVTQYSL
ncbi:unnamed protein product [Acanthoscelides obtectus]|uniref:Uncharacterized protein n=1 Tax=Acanthoscelides obtectus TaxID=200917 RepID=A0A9P0JJT3_ACAOB|nr:unnamed protein product [Acanthoscelides obtectus]CAK1678463.1 hypothetical protein AOBTE_LOCUS31917 [Acanthoscelides obtectus]